MCLLTYFPVFQCCRLFHFSYSWEISPGGEHVRGLARREGQWSTGQYSLGACPSINTFLSKGMKLDITNTATHVFPLMPYISP